MKVAITHDYLTQRGGAERVVLALAEMFPQAPIYTSLYDPDDTFPEFRGLDVRTSALQRLPHRGGAFRAYLPLYPRAFDSFDLGDVDVVVSSSSGWAHGVRTGRAVHVVYCHAPAKWLYRGAEYAGTGPRRWAMRLGGPIFERLRRWDRAAAQRPEAYVANSTFIAEQIRSLYGRTAEVIPPPVEVPAFGSVGPPQPDAPYLVVARLLPYKRVDLAVRVCTARAVPLTVVGEGPERARLAEMAGPTVRFAGALSQQQLRAAFEGCRALIQPGREDFGIVPIEANAAGRPVIAFGAGGALDSVSDGSSGVLFGEQTQEDLADAMDRAASITWDADRLQAHAASFSRERFMERMQAVVDGAVAARGVRR